MAKAKKIKEVKEPKPKAATIFDYISWLTNKKRTWEELSIPEQKGFSIFMINKWLSMDLDLCEAINEMQEYVQSMDKKVFWKLYYNILPKQSFFLKYIKATPVEGINEKEINIFIKHFNCSEKEAIDYLYLLNKKGLQEEIENIKSSYKYE